MDSLKAVLERKRKEKEELVGQSKFVKRADLEAAKLAKLREEEEKERLAKVRCCLLVFDALLERSRSNGPPRVRSLRESSRPLSRGALQRPRLTRAHVPSSRTRSSSAVCGSWASRPPSSGRTMPPGTSGSSGPRPRSR